MHRSLRIAVSLIMLALFSSVLVLRTSGAISFAVLAASSLGLVYGFFLWAARLWAEDRITR